MINNKIINQIKEKALNNNIPIITDTGISYLMKYIKRNKIKKILEIGTAVGYSAIKMCSVDDDIYITSIERDEKRYLEAIKNIKKAGLQDRIHLIYKDALEVDLEDKYDMIFIDAAKAQYTKFFQLFEDNLIPNGCFITDNMSFHGLVEQDESKIASRNVRQLVRKVKKYKEFLMSNHHYRTQFLEIGDGIAISIKK